jgi:hypothetical protein
MIGGHGRNAYGKRPYRTAHTEVVSPDHAMSIVEHPGRGTWFG